MWPTRLPLMNSFCFTKATQNNHKKEAWLSPWGGVHGLQMSGLLSSSLFSFLQVSDLEDSRALNSHRCHSPESRLVEQNGEVAAADVIQLQKHNRELEQQVAEKNKVN